ncbi:protein KRI1 homolog [Haematobia irritans]|uniref:protein KRI1 homolog n=1 Tax=Haematobia irritans TaxID=7368 RepID=UPI003F4FCAB1
MSKQLFDDSDDNSEKGFQINTNESYAKSYNYLRKKELLQKFKEKGFEASDSESSSEESSEDDEVLDPTFDQEFLSTLASLKSKDPKIYDKNTKFFEKVNKNIENVPDVDGDSNAKSGRKEKKLKPVTLKDYERKIILEKGGKFVDDCDDDDEPGKFSRENSPTLVEEERQLKDEFKKVMNDDDSEDEEFGGIFKKRQKTKIEQDAEQEDYLKWLAGKKETIKEDAEEKLKPLKNYWSNEKLPSSEKFLRDYILNKGYTDAENYAEIPTYEEIVGDNGPLSEDEEELEKQAEFEEKYNFRFEDPDQEFIKRYPRTIEASVRRTDDKRKQKRQEIKERKQQEKELKMKELEMAKEMKRKEIQEKIEKLKMVTGNDELGFKDDDLEEDFDPEAHDRRMHELFNDDYYNVDEGEQKPECPSDIDELKVEDWDNYDPQHDWTNEEESYEPHCEDEDFIMDCDYDPAKAKEQMQKELIENTKTRKGRKGRRDRFMAMIKAEKPVFDPEDEKTYGEYIDEYYQLDCEDIIGDTPCRFKYVETTPNDFGLTIEEILLAKNKELNQWASLKKAIQIRPDHVEKKEQRLYKMKAKNEDLKRKIFKSIYGEGSDNENEYAEPDIQDSTENVKNNDNNNTINTEQGESKKAKKRRKRKANKSQSAESINNTGITRTSKQFNDESLAKKLKMDEVSNEDEKNVNLDDKKANRKKNKKNNMLVTTEKHLNCAVTNSSGGTANDQIGKNDKQELATPVAGNRQISKKGNPFSNRDKTNQQQTSPTNKSNTKVNPFNVNGPQNRTTNLGSSSLPPLRQNKKPNQKPKPKFRNEKQHFNKKSNSDTISDERLKAYGINPKKFHKKQKYGTQNTKKQE